MEKLITELEERMIALREQLATVKISIVTEDQYDNGDDIIYEMPRVWDVSKHFYHIEYVILRVENGRCYCGGIGEDYGDLKYFDLDNLSFSEIFEIAKTVLA